MRRADFEHVIRAAAELAGDDEIVVIGSQAILGQFPDAPSELLEYQGADVYPRRHPERADLVDGSIGELSPFHSTYGYYAHGVGSATAVLPAGWQRRLVPIESAGTRGSRGLCLEVHDLLVSKYAAGREKDREFARVALRHGLADGATLLRRLAQTPLDDEEKGRVEAMIRADVRRGGAGREAGGPGEAT